MKSRVFHSLHRSVAIVAFGEVDKIFLRSPRLGYLAATSITEERVDTLVVSLSVKDGASSKFRSHGQLPKRASVRAGAGKASNLEMEAKTQQLEGQLDELHAGVDHIGSSAQLGAPPPAYDCIMGHSASPFGALYPQHEISAFGAKAPDGSSPLRRLHVLISCFMSRPARQREEEKPTTLRDDSCRRREMAGGRLFV